MTITHYTGYQWGDDGSYIGTYAFDSVGDTPHLPPRTTLVPPPACAPGTEAAWDGADWVVRAEDLGWMG